MKRIRADELLSMQTGVSRSQTRLLIMEGKVRLKGSIVLKPGELVPVESVLEVEQPQKFVSRGGFKLESALDQFNLDVSDLICIDVGASTGGFSDCLLQHGAKTIYAVDVGSSQLAPKIATDKRVIVMDKTNARFLTPAHFNTRPQVAVVDCSFISGNKVIAPLKNILTEPAFVVWLLKPQFEAGPGKVGKKGVIKREDVLKESITKALLRVIEIPSRIINACTSPITGADGNREFLILLGFDDGVGLSHDDVLEKLLPKA